MAKTEDEVKQEDEFYGMDDGSTDDSDDDSSESAFDSLGYFTDDGFVGSLQVGGSLDTTYEVLPAGLYKAVLSKDKCVVKRGKTKKDESKYWYAFEPVFVITDPKAKKYITTRDEVIVRSKRSLFLDMDESSGSLSIATGKGKNVELGRLAEAVGIRGSFAFPKELYDKPLTVKIEVLTNQDDNHMEATQRRRRNIVVSYSRLRQAS